MKIADSFKSVAVGQKFACKYPQHGTRNILCNQVGKVKHVGESYIKIEREDGSFRNLRAERMVDAVVG